MDHIGDHFAHDYVGARAKFLRAARQSGARLEEHLLPELTAPGGEPLAMDVALIGDPDAAHLVVVSSGTHGLEGQCGSGIQVALLADADLHARMKAARAALLLVHAVNPHGFAHGRRVNEENVDVNRNAVDFSRPRPLNPAYDELEPLLIPPTWPPSAENRAALDAFIRERGLAQYQAALTLGQYVRPQGMFFGGDRPSWSVATLDRVLRQHGQGRSAIAWVDIHTALGPRGHGEKIQAGEPSEFPMSRFLWGADVVSLSAGDSSSAKVTGPVSNLLGAACPGARRAGIALEYGTRPLPEVLDALRADHWMHRHRPDARTSADLKTVIRAAFYDDSDDWRGMVVGQARTAVLQAATGLGQWRPEP
jgi:hypothetical protein